MTGFLVITTDKNVIKPINFRTTEEACKFVLATPGAVLYEIVENQQAADIGDHTLFDFIQRKPLDPVLIQPPTPEPYLDYKTGDL